MHQREQTVRVILNLDVNVEFDMRILLLKDIVEDQHRAVRGVRLTFMSIMIVSANVGIPCLGSFIVLTCSNPFSPCHARSFIKPAHINKHRGWEYNPDIDNLSSPSFGRLLQQRGYRSATSRPPRKEHEHTWIMKHNDNIIQRYMDVC